MQNEYKNEMEKISLSDSDKARILANVKKAYDEQQGQTEQKVVEFSRKPRFSPRRIGAIAAAFAVVIIGGALVVRQLVPGETGNIFKMPGVFDPNDPMEEVVWVELDSVADIEEKTDCKTYTLGNISKDYKVKKVEVAEEQKHVRITYRNKKEHDKILFEYKEEKSATELTEQFSEVDELATEKVGESSVTMYGKKDCEGMTWEDEECTFAVKMTKACSKESAKKIVSETREGNHVDKADEEIEKVNDDLTANSVGWEEDEEESSEEEKKEILKKIYDQFGFRVTVEEPARRITYKKVGAFESFAFYYDDNEELEDHRVIGYVGWHESPDGVLDGYEELESITINGNPTTIYQKAGYRNLFQFKKQNLVFTILVEQWQGDNYPDVIGELMTLFRVSMDSGEDKDEPDSGDDEVEIKNKDDEKDTKDDEEPEKIPNATDAAVLRESAREIQDAVAGEELYSLIPYMQFPLTISGLDITVSGESEFKSVETASILTSDWIDAVVSFNINEITSKTKTFVMGDEKNAIVCKIKNNSVVITELRVAIQSDEPAEPTATPEV